MAIDLEISNLPGVSVPADTDEFPVVQGGVTLKGTFGQYMRQIPIGSMASPGFKFLGGAESGLYYDQGGIEAHFVIAGASVGSYKAGGIVIPSFVNSNHDHSNSANGGLTAHEILTNNPHGVSPAQISIPKIGTPTYDNLEDHLTVAGSAGLISGGTITDGGSNTFDVAAGTGFIRIADDHVADLKSFNWSASTGNALADGQVRFIGIEYNAGSPQVVVKTTDVWNYHDEWPIGAVVAEGTTTHQLNNPAAIKNGIAHIIERLYRVNNTERDEKTGGLLIGETGTRNLTLSTGILWNNLNDFVIPALDTSVTGDFHHYFRDGSGGWTKDSGGALTQWPNTQYDDDSGTLATMTNNRYANLWIFLEIDDGDVAMVYGQTEYTSLAVAELEGAPSVLPPRLATMGKLIGRIIFQKSGATAEEIQTVFVTTFNISAVSDHGNLTGLSDDDHPHYRLVENLNDNTAINGGLKAWQRGTGTTDCPVATETYLADRVFVTPVGATMTQARSATVRTGAREKYSLLLTGAASVTTVNVMLQRYEAINIPAIKGIMSFSIWFLNNSGAGYTPTLLLGTPGAEDNYTTVTNRLSQVLQTAVNGAWTQLTYTVDISGYTNINNGLQVELQIPSGSLVAGDTANLAEFQFERSSLVSPFAPRNFGAELSACKRYLPVGDFSGAFDIVGMVQLSGASAGICLFHFDVEPRIAPTGLIATANQFAVSTQEGTQTINAISWNAQTSKHTTRITLGWATPITFLTPDFIKTGTLSSVASPTNAKIIWTGCEL